MELSDWLADWLAAYQTDRSLFSRITVLTSTHHILERVSTHTKKDNVNFHVCSTDIIPGKDPNKKRVCRRQNTTMSQKHAGEQDEHTGAGGAFTAGPLSQNNVLDTKSQCPFNIELLTDRVSGRLFGCLTSGLTFRKIQQTQRGADWLIGWMVVVETGLSGWPSDSLVG